MKPTAEERLHHAMILKTKISRNMSRIEELQHLVDQDMIENCHLMNQLDEILREDVYNCSICGNVTSKSRRMDTIDGKIICSEECRRVVEIKMESQQLKGEST